MSRSLPTLLAMCYCALTHPTLFSNVISTVRSRLYSLPQSLAAHRWPGSHWWSWQHVLPWTRQRRDTKAGENVNAFEIEDELLQHGDVITVAAFGIPSQLGGGTEDDIKVAVVPWKGSPERGFDEKALWDWLFNTWWGSKFPESSNLLPRRQRDKIEKSFDIRTYFHGQVPVSSQ